MSRRERFIQLLSTAAMIALSILAARYGIPIPPPTVIIPPAGEPGGPALPPPTPTPTPDPLNAIVRISSGNVGCSATIIGPRRADGRWWVLTAAHCTNATGQRWTMKFRDGRSAGMTIVNFDRRADWAWGVTDADGSEFPFALLADVTPAAGTRVWHAGFGVDVPSNREDGTVTAGANSDGQVQYRISVSSGDSGGGIVTDANGRVLSPVCCTTRRGGIGEVWGASPEACKAGRRDVVLLDQWEPLDIPLREVPQPMPAGK